ncbi:MAG: FAD-binding oxidoreductase [Phycisphaeraceae bacterium]
MVTWATQSVGGWGRFPIHDCPVSRPDGEEQVRSALSGSNGRSIIARGLGRSYGDPAINNQGGVVLQAQRNRMLAFDKTTGVLTAEAGVSLAEIIDAFLPRGYFLPTTPGTKFVTLGGAIAADIHGKNHHIDGSFGSFITSLRLMLANGSILTCARDENPDVFAATLGGMGLTGIILSASLRLRRVPSAYYQVAYRRASNLDAALELFDRTDTEYPYSVAWIDCLGKGSSLGRSVLMLGRDAQPTDLPDRLRDTPYQIRKQRTKSVPFDFPAIALNSWSVKAFNTLFYAKHADTTKIVDYDTYFYPLDSIHAWNRIYGRRGFIQYQVLLPRENSREGLIRVLEAISSAGAASFLAVLKTSGRVGDGLLSYLFPGHTLALDIPNYGPQLFELTRKLDRMLLDAGGRLYLAKDATMDAETFSAMYPNLNRFKAIKNKVDPDQRFDSVQAQRLGITEPR